MRASAKFQGSERKPYDVVADTTTGVAWCSCKHWKFQKEHPRLRQCKHTRNFLAMLTQLQRVGDSVASSEFFEVQAAPSDWSMMRTVVRTFTKTAVVPAASESRFAVLDLDGEVAVAAASAFGRVVDMD